MANAMAPWAFSVLGLSDLGMPYRLAMTALMAELALAVSVIVVIWHRQLDMRKTLGLSRPGLVPTLCAVVVVAGGGFVLDEVMYLMAWLFPSLRTGGLAIVGEALASATVRDGLILLVPVALAPALCEEALCRGVILLGLLKKWPSARWAPVLLSAGFFGLIHPDALHAPMAALMGVLLGIVALRTGSLLPPLICHLLNNVVSIFTPILGGPGLPQILERGHGVGVVVVALIGMVGGFVGLYITTSPQSGDTERSEEKEQDRSADDDHRENG